MFTVVWKSTNEPAEAITRTVLENFGLLPNIFIMNEDEFSMTLTNTPYKTLK
tara:strand:- start:1363 stop:1518 length:156 start_codon:yes stop_codon:yes gene_type:complete